MTGCTPIPPTPPAIDDPVAETLIATGIVAAAIVTGGFVAMELTRRKDGKKDRECCR